MKYYKIIIYNFSRASESWSRTSENWISLALRGKLLQKLTSCPACWYSSDISRWVLSDECLCARVSVIFQVFSLCIVLYQLPLAWGLNISWVHMSFLIINSIIDKEVNFHRNYQGEWVNPFMHVTSKTTWLSWWYLIKKSNFQKIFEGEMFISN